MGRPATLLNPSMIKEVAVRIAIGRYEKIICAELGISEHILKRIMETPDFSMLVAAFEAEIEKQIRQVKL